MQRHHSYIDLEKCWLLVSCLNTFFLSIRKLEVNPMEAPGKSYFRFFLVTMVRRIFIYLVC